MKKKKKKKKKKKNTIFWWHASLFIYCFGFFFCGKDVKIPPKAKTLIGSQKKEKRCYICSFHI